MKVAKNKAFKYFTDPLLWLCVIIPTICLTIYYGFIASDVYISESKFVIRSPDKQSVSGLGVVLKSIGFNNASDDSYIVRDYLDSRDAVKTLDKTLKIRQKYASQSVDTFSRFGGFFQNDTFENFYQYFKKKVTVNYDTASAISELKVRAYTPEDAQRINQELLGISEVVINRINTNAKNDLIVYSKKEVEEAQVAAQTAATNLANYRKGEEVYNPEGQSMIVLQEISKLQDSLLQAKTQLAQAKELAPDNPQIPSLELKVSSLEAEIKKKSAQVVGPTDKSLTNKSADYQRLQLEVELANKQLAAAMVSYDQAKNDLNKKQLYLERLVEPSKPDEALEPTRLRNILSGFVFGLILWGVLRLFVAGVKEHKA